MFIENANGAAKWGVILGLTMSLSRIVELNMLMNGDWSEFTMISLEWLAAIFIYVYILFRANREMAIMMVERGVVEKYKFRNTLNYTVLISIFVAFMVAVSSHIYVTKIVGGYDILYGNVTSRLDEVLSVSDIPEGTLSALLERSTEAISAISETPPTILSVVLSFVSNYVIYGFLTSLVIVGFVKRSVSRYINQNSGENGAQ